MNDVLPIYMSLEEIDRYLGYTAEEESKFTQRPLEELGQERLKVSRMPTNEATDFLDKKMMRLSVMTTTDAAAHYGTSSNNILRMAREDRIPSFKRAHHHWRVWVDQSTQELPKTPQHKKMPE